MKRAADAGWTLIELLIVISLIMILSAVAIAAYAGAVTRAREAALMTDLHEIREAIDQHYADNGRYPESLAALVPLYIRAVPRDPFTDSNQTWLTTHADEKVGGFGPAPGIYEVKSGSERTALNGSRYADW